MEPIELEIRQWLAQVVVGLNLCPFAARPAAEGRVRVHISAAADEAALLTDLQFELQRLDEVDSATLETTLIAVPNMLADFADYNDFLDLVDELLDRNEWSGDYQVASFHPHYQFAGTAPQDAENLSNRSPYPLLHLLRESSVEAAIEAHPDTARIPDDNIRRLRELNAQQRRQLFSYLK